jgi:glucose/mannose transport system permease protein
VTAAELPVTVRHERRRRKLHLQAIIATSPMIVIGLSVFLVGVLFTIYWSFTSSRVFPGWGWVGLRQYWTLWSNPAWLTSISNMAVFGPASLAINLVLGFFLAASLDRSVRLESLFRTIFLYPFAMSLYVTGLVWQWILDPSLGLQVAVQNWGFADFHFAPLNDPGQAIAALTLAGCWQSVGLTMAIMLAGLRGIDPDIWSASRIDGIPAWRTYAFIVVPMLRGAVATALLLQITSIIRTYDLVVAIAVDPYKPLWMPALYVMNTIRFGSNLGQGTAAAAMMLVPIAVALVIRAILSRRRRHRAGINA